ncbi:hypothetical protein G6F59_017129 [Rhizopus arrhizus]|nr:hypothetical protein G6F59_017129 [Rhizopus arrhizus]
MLAPWTRSLPLPAAWPGPSTPTCCAATIGPGRATPRTRPRRISTTASTRRHCVRRSPTAPSWPARCRCMCTCRSAPARASTAAATG